ncbi:MAG: hypothetical protein KAR06_06520 [Deltaproteobacteria bacterium]|nr:hypothetical protein [Deltaproteobacteria bacterium]
MSKIIGKLRIVMLKEGGLNLSIDLPKDVDHEKLRPIVFGLAAGDVAIVPAMESMDGTSRPPLERALAATRDLSAALLEIADQDPQAALDLAQPSPLQLAPTGDEPSAEPAGEPGDTELGPNAFTPMKGKKCDEEQGCEENIDGICQSDTATVESFCFPGESPE